MVCTLLAGVNVVAFAADDNDLIVSVHSFYNDAQKGGDGEHLYTKDADEMSWLSSLPTWNDENEAWKAPVSSSLAVYRVYNPNSGEHHYAAADEAEWLVSQGWTQEKIAFYSDDNMGVPVYRLWNGGEGVGSHYYTTDEGEAAYLASIGWTAEGVNFYGVKEEGEKEMTAAQTGADEITVSFSTSFAADDSLVVEVDGIEETPDVQFTTDRTVAVLTFDTPFTDDQVVEINAVSGTYEEAIVVTEASEIADVYIADALVFQGGTGTDQSPYMYATAILAYDQFGDTFEVDLDKILIGTTDVTAFRNAETGVTGLISGTTKLTEGTVLPVSVVEGTFVKTGQVTVSAASQVQTMLVSELQMTEDEAEINTTGRVDVNDLFANDDAYYFEITALDQYGMPLGADQLNNMVANNGTLIVKEVSNALKPSTAGAPFDELEDGTVVMFVRGDGETYGSGVINMVSTSGMVTSASAEVSDNEKITELNFEIAKVQVGKGNLAALSATNQYGEPVDFTDEDEVTIVATDGVDEAKIKYVGGDGRTSNAEQTANAASIDLTNAVFLGVEYNDDYGVWVVPVVGTDDATKTAMVTTTTVKPSINTKTYTIADAAGLKYIDGLADNITPVQLTSKSGSAISVFASEVIKDNFTWLDSDGDKVTDTNLVPLGLLTNAEVVYGDALNAVTGNNYVIRVTSTDEAFNFDANGNATPVNTAKAGKHNVQVTLYAPSGEANKLGTKLDAEKVTCYIFDEEDENLTYTATLYKGNNPLTPAPSSLLKAATTTNGTDWTQGDTGNIIVFAIDSNGAMTRVTSGLWAESTLGLAVGEDEGIFTVGDLTASGCLVGKQMYAAELTSITDYVTIYNGTEAVTTVEVNLSNTANMPAMVIVEDEDEETVTTTTFKDVVELSVTDGVLTIENEDGYSYAASVYDQYGNPLTTAATGAAWSYNGTLIDDQPVEPAETGYVTIRLATGVYKLTIVAPED